MTVGVLDVHYGTNVTTAAMVVLDDWTAAPRMCVTTRFDGDLAGYEPGAFYKRELPPLTDLIRTSGVNPDVLVVDAHVYLNDGRSGMGYFLWYATGITVVGIAKSEWPGNDAVEVLRGDSKKPLYVTACGMGQHRAALYVASMHGAHRLPTACTAANSACRQAAEYLNNAKELQQYG